MNRNAQKMTVDEVKGKFKSLTQGQKSENVVNWMANTFKVLCDFADWSAPAVPPEQHVTVNDTEEVGAAAAPAPNQMTTGSRELELHYNIQLILPESRDPAVFDALFASLRRHLM